MGGFYKANIVHIAIDFSQLGLEKTEEKEDVIEIGAMTCLRKIEEMLSAFK